MDAKGIKVQQKTCFVRDVAGICLLWLASRALPLYWNFTGLNRKFDYETLQIRKLLQYGFWERKGAMIHPEAGLLAHPWNFNYTHHPFPIYWLYAFLYQIGGQVLIYTFIAGVGLASCIAVYVILQRYFSPNAARWAAALFVVAQGSVEFDINTDTVALGSVVWILSMLMISRVQRENREFATRELWLLGLGVFVAGQISWFALTVLPALLIISIPREQSILRGVWRALNLQPGKALLLGGIATLMVFLLQVFLYTPNGGSNDRTYLREQLGFGGVSRWANFPWMCCRMIESSPALWCGAILAIVRCGRSLRSNRLFIGACIYAPILLTVCLILPGLLARNQHGFRYPLFSCAILVAFLFERKATPWLKAGLTTLAVAGLLLGYAKIPTVNKASAASYTLGEWIAENSSPRDLILYNRTRPTPPVQAYDLEFAACAGWTADRLMYSRVDDPQAAAIIVRPFASAEMGLLFLREMTQPVSEEMDTLLQRDAILVAATNLPVPPEPVSLYKLGREQLRSLVSSKDSLTPQPVAEATATNCFSLRLYRFNSNAIEIFLTRQNTNDHAHRQPQP